METPIWANVDNFDTFWKKTLRMSSHSFWSTFSSLLLNMLIEIVLSMKQGHFPARLICERVPARVPPAHIQVTDGETTMEMFGEATMVRAGDSKISRNHHLLQGLGW